MTTTIPPPPPGVPPCPVPPPSPGDPLTGSAGYPGGKDALGRFTPGNPGKQKGTRSRITRLLEQMCEGEALSVMSVAVAVALRGDMAAAKLILERAAPARKGALVALRGFPKISGPTDVPTAIAFLWAAVVEGKLSAEDAKLRADLLDGYVKAADSAMLAAGLEEVKARLDRTESRRGNR